MFVGLFLITWVGFLQRREAVVVQGGYQSEEARVTGVHDVRFPKNQ